MPVNSANGIFRPPTRKAAQPIIKKPEPAHSDFKIVRRSSLRASDVENHLQIRLTARAAFGYVVRESPTFVVLSEEKSEQDID